MRKLTPDLLNSTLRAASIKPRLRQSLRFNPDTIEDWEDMELYAVQDRTGNKGVLIIGLEDKLYALENELTTRVFDRHNCRWSTGIIWILGRFQQLR